MKFELLNCRLARFYLGLDEQRAPVVGQDNQVRKPNRQSGIEPPAIDRHNRPDVGMVAQPVAPAALDPDEITEPMFGSHGGRSRSSERGGDGGRPA